MRGRDRQIRICKVLIALNLCFIWGNSLMTAEASRAFSDWVKALLAELASGNGAGAGGSGLLRKIAHFTEFTALGLLLQWLYVLLRRKGWQPLAWGASAACMDEIIQMFVPGRGPGILDVGIDVCGVLTGIVLLQTGYRLLRRNQQRSNGGD